MPKYTLATGKDRVLTGGASHAPVKGRDTDVFVYLLPLDANGNQLRTAPGQLDLSLASGGDSTTLVVNETIDTPISAGQFLMFTDTSTGEEWLVKVATDVSSGTSIEIEKATSTAIPVGAVAQIPTYLWDRTAADVERSYNRDSFATFNTGGDEDGAITGASRTFTCPGLYYPKNAGYFTSLWAAENGREVYVQRITGDSRMEGPCVVTAAPSASPVDGNVSADLTFSFQGKPTEVLSELAEIAS